VTTEQTTTTPAPAGHPRLQDDYTITIDAFQGPMDLLLYLIRRAEVDIHDIPIASITDQYLDFLHCFEIVDIDIAGEFLVMAATLVELKSRAIAPAETSTDGETDGDRSNADLVDPRQELVQALLAYQRYRTASEALEERRLVHLQRFPLRPAHAIRAEAIADGEVELELDDVHVLDLAEAYEHIVAAIDFGRLGAHEVEMDDTPIALHQEDLLDRLTRASSHTRTLQAAFEGTARMHRIGLFLATLELVRLRRVSVLQEDINSPIELVLREDEEPPGIANRATDADDVDPSSDGAS